MSFVPDPEQLCALADVIVRVGVNLQKGQGLLLSDPFELQGVAPDAAPLVGAIRAAAERAGGGPVDVIHADPSRLRAAALAWPDGAMESTLSENARRMEAQVEAGGALLFLQASHPRLMEGVPEARVAALRERCWQHYGPVAARLVSGATNWCVAPAPTSGWAAALEAPVGDDALPWLWRVIVAACRADRPDPVEAWRAHLDRLERWRGDLDRRRVRALRIRGPGTDLTLSPAPGHRWCTAALRSAAGVPYVANLPTEEVFTAPHRASATGSVRVARPVAYGGAVIEGIELEFRRGEVVKARARVGHELLLRMLRTDGGAARLGEVAMVVRRDGPLAAGGRWFHHTLLDENALPHLALGDGYPFSVHDPADPDLNHSLVHLDLPIEAEVEVAG